MNYFKVDGMGLPPVPVGNVSYQENDLQSVGYRDELGFLHKTTVRYGVRKFELKWNTLSDKEMNQLRTLLKGKEYFRFEYICANETHTGVIDMAYAGDISYSLYNYIKGIAIWKDIKVSIIER